MDANVSSSNIIGIKTVLIKLEAKSELHLSNTLITKEKDICITTIHNVIQINHFL
jgi:hypothetical protein